ncbi:MAG: sigma 54-interacting transcriptional regulator [Archangiaceae bacterium]|nr:sigma 54-interacting transcriptional regulator [Archangiaceae bacterium]
MTSSQTITVQRRAGQELLSVREMTLEVETSKGEKARRTLGLLPLTVGTSADCDWPLQDDGVSRRHCELSLAEQGVRVRDLASKNGVWVGGAQLFDGVVGEGVTLSVGSARIKVLGGEGVTELPMSARSSFGASVGASPVMRALFAVLERAAATDAALLLLGETGTGKELLAQATHDASARKDGPFIVYDCGSSPPTLIESDLFGHLRGAFTGAQTDKKGIFELAHRGTLFLDEVAELPVELQTRLLRVVETGTVKPLGADAYREVDVRVIAATHRNLKARLAGGQFREDLYYRLAVIVAEVPPLRERKQDIPLLVEGFLQAMSPPRALEALPPSTLALLESHGWPGNVRELFNTVTRMVLFPRLGARAIDPGPAAPDSGTSGVSAELHALPLREARAALVGSFEAEYLKAKLHEHRGNVTAAARAAGVSRQFFYRLLSEHSFDEPKDE